MFRNNSSKKKTGTGICLSLSALLVAGAVGLTGCYGEYSIGNKTQATEKTSAPESASASQNESTGNGEKTTGNSHEPETESTVDECGISFANLSETVYTIKNCNIHEIPKEDSKVCFVAMKDTKLLQTGYSSEWCRVQYNGKTYYVQTRYLRSPSDEERQNEGETQQSTEKKATVTPVAEPTKKETESTKESETEKETESVAATPVPTKVPDSNNAIPGAQVNPVLSKDQILALPNDTIPWGYATNDRDEFNRPNGCLYYERLYGKYGAEFLKEKTNTIYLTFDEGYELGYTPTILDTLKAKNVKAVFFVTLQYCKDEPELVQRMIDEGHVVGNHSAAHPSGGLPQFGYDGTLNDLTKVHDYVKTNFGYDMYLMRYPEGAFSEQSLALLQSMGYRTVFWSFAHADWDPNNQPEVSATYQRVTSQLHPGAIYLLHAVSQSDTQALPDFIDYAQQNGYTFGYYD